MTFTQNLQLAATSNFVLTMSLLVKFVIIQQNEIVSELKKVGMVMIVYNKRAIRLVTVPNAAMPPEFRPNRHQHRRKDGTDTAADSALMDSGLTNHSSTGQEKATLPTPPPPGLRRRGEVAGSSSHPALRTGRA